MKLWITVISLLPASLFADTIHLTSGEPIIGVVESMTRGRITIRSGNQSQQVDVLKVDHIDFDTPHLSEGTANQTLEHFRQDMDAQETIRLSRELKAARQETRATLNQIEAKWKDRKQVEPAQAQLWAAEKERFGAPLARYHAALDDLYRHIAAQVDEYNKLSREANGVHIGVKGIFNIGSSLVPDDKKELAPKEFLPKRWYESIFYDGYSKGFKDAKEYERLTP